MHEDCKFYTIIDCYRDEKILENAKAQLL